MTINREVEQLQDRLKADARRAPAERLRAAWTPHEGGQRDVLDRDARFKVVSCGRRWGKTELASFTAAEFALEHDGALVWWVAPNYNQADVGVRTIRSVLPDSVSYDLTRSEPKNVRFQNGSEISFRSADHPDTLRGVGLDYLVVDEAAWVSAEAWHEALRPTLADTEGGMMAISTPKARNWFYRLYERGASDDDDDAPYASFRYPTWENPHISADEIDEARTSIPDRAFRQEYGAEFVSGAGSVFTGLDDIVEAYDWEARNGEPPFTIGVDFARHENWTVIVTLDGTGTLVGFDRLQNTGWPQIQRAVMRADERVGDRATVYLDATRDNKIVSDLEAAGVYVRPETFTQTNKQRLIDDLITLVENGSLTLPESLREPIVRELELYEYDVTSAGNVRYHAPPGFHDDCVDALALAGSGLDAGTSTGVYGLDIYHERANEYV